MQQVMQEFFDELVEQKKLSIEPKAWILEKANSVKNITKTTHPTKFAHPDGKDVPVVASSRRENDGLVRSGNAEIIVDFSGSAGLLQIHKFLSLKENNQSLCLLEHLEQDTDEIQQAFAVFGIYNKEYLDIKEKYLQCIKNKKIETSSLLKQVYFPVSKNNYHLLSLLTSSGLIFLLKNKIDQLKKNKYDVYKKNKEANQQDGHEKNQIFESYQQCYGLTYIFYGGGKPQNISFVNCKARGHFYLLPSFPPLFNRSYHKLPKKDFFRENLFFEENRELFNSLAKHTQFFIFQRSNQENRDAIKEKLAKISGIVLEEIFRVRSAASGWSKKPFYKNLPEYQAIFLDDIYSARRAQLIKNNPQYVEEIVKDCARWIMKGCRRINNNYENAKEDLDFIVNVIKDELQDICCN